ncbi:RNA helicase OS=Rhodanobacter lindaniclasticus OX=75310 GN=B1991_08865 PE=3 SV=1 [Rhodanobacter lindaniclasticus]
MFSRTKHGADKLVTFLNASGLRAAAIHGNKSQNARTRALGDFKSGRVTVLVAAATT